MTNFTSTQIEQLHEQTADKVATMTSRDLFDWYDDMDAILQAMPREAREAYYTAHRELVAKAIVDQELNS